MPDPSLLLVVPANRDGQSSSSMVTKKHPRQLQQQHCGVRLKRFEQALTKLLPAVEPRYTRLPPPPANTNAFPMTSGNEGHWEVSLPPAARVHGTLPGQLSNPQRAQRKADQIRSMFQCIFALLPEHCYNNNNNNNNNNSKFTYTIVDFGGGSGHLSLPLALLLPKCNIIVVDLKPKSLEFLHEKAKNCVEHNQHYKQDETTKDSTTEPQDGSNHESNTEVKTKTTETSNTATTTTTTQLTPTAISNLWTFCGDIDSFSSPTKIDIGVALHVCGEATDVVLRKCAHYKAHIVVAPCCVGKLNQQTAKDPYIYRATGQNTPTISYPQSTLFQQCLSQQAQHFSQHDQNHHHQQQKQQQQQVVRDDWDALAKAADYCHELDMQDRRNASRRTAKSLLEMDRQLFLQEHFSYQTVMTRMHPLTASPKHDIIIAYYSDIKKKNKRHYEESDISVSLAASTPIQNIPPASIAALLAAEQHEDVVVRWTKEYLQCQSETSSLPTGTVNICNDHNGSPQQNCKNCYCVPAHKTSHKKVDVAAATSSTTTAAAGASATERVDSVDWTWQEEQEIRSQLMTHFPPLPLVSECNRTAAGTLPMTGDEREEPESTLVFPPGMGGRKRKLIHFLAEQLGLAHFGIGKKHAEKTVAVRRRYIQKQPQS